jgi:hypothetical protein
MNTRCEEWEIMLRESEDCQASPALQAHARQCSACAEKLRQWQEISNAARSLQKSWHSPGLWPRIHQALAVESQHGPARILQQPWTVLETVFRYWRIPAVAFMLLLIAISAVWILRQNYRAPETAGREGASEKRLLNERALKEIEAAEAAYIQSIEKLSSRIQPALEGASSPLMMNYREKLALIDSAIADCRANIDRNRFNAYLRKELLSIYQEKERTLVDLIKENKNEQP